MKVHSMRLIAFSALLLAGIFNGAVIADEPAPIKVLLITGGCCHDYPFQTKALQDAATARNVVIEWTVVNEGGKGTSAQIDLYKNPDWAKGYDVVVHNECFAATKD